MFDEENVESLGILRDDESEAPYEIAANPVTRRESWGAN
jgi:hypothetical protein